MRFFFRILWTSFAFGVLLTSSLNAEWRWQLYLGKASTSDSDLRIVQPSLQNNLLFHNIEYKDKSFRTPLYYGLRTTYFKRPCSDFGLEVEFIHAKIYSNSQQIVFVSGTKEGGRMDSTMRLGELVQGFSMTHGLNFLFFNLVGRFNFSEKDGNLLNKIKLFVRLGIGPSIPHTESVIQGIKKEQYELHIPAYQIAAGPEIKIWRSLRLLMEYKGTWVRVKDAQIANGYAETKLWTNHLVLGVGTKL